MDEECLIAKHGSTPPTASHASLSHKTKTDRPPLHPPNRATGPPRTETNATSPQLLGVLSSGRLRPPFGLRTGGIAAPSGDGGGEAAWALQPPAESAAEEAGEAPHTAGGGIG
eukprot:scaffold404_cov101-Isochrysis_galbana.AAC.6